MRYKKSQLFGILLVVAAAIVLSTAFIIISGKTSPYRKQVGVRSLNIYKTYQEMEKVLIYVDQSARFSAYNAIFEAAADGGFAGDSECGRYSGYNLLNNAAEDCSLDLADYEKNLKDKILGNLKRYLGMYPVNEKRFPGFKLEISKLGAGYDLLFDEEDLIGIAEDDVSIIMSGNDIENVWGVHGKYIIKPSFNVDIGYGVNEYEVLRSQIAVIYECKSESDITLLVDCVKQKKPNNWKLREDLAGKGRTLAFDVTSDYTLVYYDKTDGLTYLKPVVYKFAVYFP